MRNLQEHQLRQMKISYDNLQESRSKHKPSFPFPLPQTGKVQLLAVALPPPVGQFHHALGAAMGRINSTHCT